jgi:hypothetical protein
MKINTNSASQTEFMLDNIDDCCKLVFYYWRMTMIPFGRIFLVLILTVPVVLLAQFSNEIDISLPGSQAMRWGDWNSDGLPDLVVAAPDSTGELAIWVFSAIPNGLEQTQILPGHYSLVCSLDWDDIDYDGDIDLMVSGVRNNNSGFYIFQNNPAGFNEIPVQLISDNPPILTETCKLVWGDINGDWVKDLVLTGYPEEGLRVFIRSGIAELTDTGQQYYPGTTVNSAQIIDFDSDGDNDIVTTNKFAYLRNHGGHFALVDQEIQPAGLFRIIHDVDGNGQLDQVFEKQYYNESLNFMVSQIVIGYGLFPVDFISPDFLFCIDSRITEAICDTDYNLDGFSDILAMRPAPCIAVRDSLNYIYYYSENEFYSDASASTIDYNCDGKPDLSFCSDFGVRRRLNLAPQLNNPPSIPQNISVQNYSSHVLITWDDAIDDITPSASIAYNIRLSTSDNTHNIISSNSLPDGRLLYNHRGNVGYANYVRLFGLEPGVQYRFDVQAIDNSGKGSFFGRTFFTALESTSPANVINMQPIPDQLVSDIRVTLSWEPDLENGGIPDYYELYLGTDGTGSNILNGVNTGANTTYTVDLAGHEVYYWRVKAYNSDGSSSGHMTSIRTASFLSIPPNALSTKRVREIKRHINENGDVLYLMASGPSDGSGDTLSVYSQQDLDFIARYTFPSDVYYPFNYCGRQSFDWLDFDQNGYGDVFFTTSWVIYYDPEYRGELWQSTNTFSYQQVPLNSYFADPPGTDPMAYPFEITDINGDGRKDMLRQNVDTSPYYDAFHPNLMLGGEDGLLHEAQVALPQMRITAWDTADYDLDGDMDILLIGSSNNYTYLKLLSNDNLIFTEVQLPQESNLLEIKWLDFDADGWPDIFLTVGSSTDGFRLLHNLEGVFVPQPLNVLTSPFYYAVNNWDWADFDNDGDPDLLYSGREPTQIYRNDMGVLTPNIIGVHGGEGYMCRWIDIDNDGALDFLISKPLGLQKTLFYKQFSSQLVPVADLVQPYEMTKLSCFPNPSSGNISITWQLPSKAPAELNVYNLKGQLVRKIDIVASVNSCLWDGKDTQCNDLPSGIYLVRLSGRDFSLQGKVTLIK